MPMLNSIRARMTFGFVLALAPLLALACLVLVFVGQRIDADQSHALARRTVMQAAEIVSQPGWQTGLTRLMSQPDVREHDLGLVVIGDHHRPIWRSAAGFPMPPFASDGDWHVIRRRAGKLTILMIHAGPEAITRNSHLVWELGALSLCVLLAAAAGAWGLVGRTLRPIHQLSRQAAAASAENLQAQLTAPSPDAEVQELVGTLNGLLARQAQTAAARGRFYAAASHELRTPLQALSGHLELALSRPRPAAEYESALQEAQGQTQRLISLVRALLLLHQLEGQLRPPQEPIDLAAVIRDALGDLHRQPLEHGLHWETAVPPAVFVCAAPTHAEILARNLLENAARYTAAAGQVSVTLAETREMVQMEIVNDCALPEGDDPQAWLDPFRRPDAARAAHPGGNGLGLAICRALSEANGWQFLMQRTTTGVRATVAFPAATVIEG